MNIAIVGAGRVGTAMGTLLARGGHTVVAASGRGPASKDRAARYLPGVPFCGSVEAATRSEVVLLSVPDDRIEEVCGTLALRGALGEGRTVIHLSGSNPLGDLDAARKAGARVLSIHPLQSAPDVETALDRFPGSGFAVTATDEEGFAVGERLAADAGGRPFRVLEEHKPLYHAAAVFCANYLTVVEGIAERLFTAAGVTDPRPLFGPLAEASLENALLRGAAASLTGPVVRGDAGTVRRNLEALRDRAPECVPIYLTLARAALDQAAEGGRPDPLDRARVQEVLDAWT